jgi:DNA-binding NarL/FixJ family response regulator
LTVRVLLVDDAAFVREGFRMVLEPEPGIEVVGEAADGLAGVAAAERLRPDVVLMDVRMPALDGIEATRRIVALDGPPARVLMLTTFDLSEYLLEALDAGVSGFALKDTPPEELVAGVLAIARDDALVDPETMVRLIRRSPRPRPPSPPLGPEQRALLDLVAEGLPDAAIGERLGLDRAAVAARYADLRAALGVRDRIHAVLMA